MQGHMDLSMLRGHLVKVAGTVSDSDVTKDKISALLTTGLLKTTLSTSAQMIYVLDPAIAVAWNVAGSWRWLEI